MLLANPRLSRAIARICRIRSLLSLAITKVEDWAEDQRYLSIIATQIRTCLPELTLLEESLESMV